MQDGALQDLKQFISNSRRLLVITGAGCSTASGIGDYRDDQGEWKRVQPVQHQEFMSSLYWRQRYWARSQVGYPDFLRAAPNAAHQTLAAWEREGHVCGLITQNVDRLHQRAGHQQVIDLHGRLDQVVCMQCGHMMKRAVVQSWLDVHNKALDAEVTSQQAEHLAPDGDADVEADDFSAVKVPECPQCAGILKPDVVFYGDSVPGPVVQQAYDWVDAADAVLVVGSSLMVFSSFRFVRRAAEAGIPVAAINRGRTRGDEYFTCKVEQDCGRTLQLLSNSL